GVLENATRTIIERQALWPFIQRQRWFAAKTKRIRQIGFSDWAVLRGGSTPAFITVVSLSYDDGGNESYTLPLAFLSDEAASRTLAEQPSGVVARITGARKGLLVDGLIDDDVCARMLSLIGKPDEVASKRGSFAGVPVLPAAEDLKILSTDLRWTRGT